MDTSDNKKRTSRIVGIVLALVLLGASAVFVITLFSATNEEPKALFGENNVEFTGQYGMTYVNSDIESISLEDSIPATGKKLDGAGIGEVKKGDWDVGDWGKCRLFVMSKGAPFVVMKTKSGYVIINYKDPDKTKALYGDLLAWLGK
jgi:hypothetical protein